MPDVSVVRVIKPSSLAVLSATPSAAASDIVVVRTATPERAKSLETLAQRNPSLIFEPDHSLRHLGNFRPLFLGLPPGSSNLTTVSIPVRIHVQDDNGRPLPNAEVVIYGYTGSEDQGKTDAGGDVTIPVTGGFLNNVVALYIKPAADYWEIFIEQPALDGNAVNNVTLHPLKSFAQAGFPGNPFVGWGQRVMGLLGLDMQQCKGANARVAIIDSGCDTGHPALSHISIGRDYTNLDRNHEGDPNTWRNDLISHGTHCAGIIAGNGKNGHIRGFAPEAEVHILKVFPGGAFSNLVAAIGYCVDNQIHVVNCSLGSDVGSELVAQRVQQARQNGVAFFVAAGNSASSVQFPASLLKQVFCVSAIGQAGNYPDYTYHARTVPDGSAVVNGQLYPARFTCHGPEVSACAPGVGIISSVPGGGYAAWDGTSMADPHLTGLGALLAAHHPQLTRATVRDAAWVDRLWDLIRSAGVDAGLTPEYGGVGLPIASKVLTGNLVAPPSQAQPQEAQTPPQTSSQPQAAQQPQTPSQSQPEAARTARTPTQLQAASQSQPQASRQLSPDDMDQLVKAVIKALPQDIVASRKTRHPQ